MGRINKWNYDNLDVVIYFLILDISYSYQDTAVDGADIKYRSVGPFEDEIPQIKNNVILTNGDEVSNQTQVDGNTLQLNVKLFLREYNREVALEAINYLVTRLCK